jgi:hypothetical protein
MESATARTANEPSDSGPIQAQYCMRHHVHCMDKRGKGIPEIRSFEVCYKTSNFYQINHYANDAEKHLVCLRSER